MLIFDFKFDSEYIDPKTSLNYVTLSTSNFLYSNIADVIGKIPTIEIKINDNIDPQVSPE